MKAKILTYISRSLALVLAGLALTSAAQHDQEKISKFERERARDMLRTIAEDVKKHYYDTKLHGVDWEANVHAADQRIEAASSLNHALSEIAAALDTLNDSHTFFLPPSRPYKHDYGWRIQMVGEKCFVMQVRPQSDADSKQVKRGIRFSSSMDFKPREITCGG